MVQGSECRKDLGKHARRVENVVVYRMLCQLQIEIDKHTLSLTATVKHELEVADQPRIKQCFCIHGFPEPCDLNCCIIYIETP